MLLVPPWAIRGPSSMFIVPCLRTPTLLKGCDLRVTTLPLPGETKRLVGCRPKSHQSQAFKRSDRFGHTKTGPDLLSWVLSSECTFFMAGPNLVGEQLLDFVCCPHQPYCSSWQERNPLQLNTLIFARWCPTSYNSVFDLNWLCLYLP